MAKPTSVSAPVENAPSDDELEALELSAVEPEPDLEPEPEPIEPEPVVAAPQGMDGWVPADQHARLQAQLEQQNRVLQEVVSRLAPQPVTDAPPATPAYTRPGDPADVTGWRGFVGETVDPVLDAKVKAAVAPLQSAMASYVDQQQEVNARNTIPDYNVYADDVRALRQEWFRTTGQVAPHVTAYHVARSMRMAAAAPASRTVAPSAVATVGRPAVGGRPKVSAAPKTLADVAGMNIKEMEAALANVRL